MPEYRVDRSVVASYADIVTAFNDGLKSRVDGRWHGDLNAFDDYLSSQEDEPYQFILVGWSWWATKPEQTRWPRIASLAAESRDLLADDPPTIIECRD